MTNPLRLSNNGPIVPGGAPGNVLTWNGSAWVSAPAGGGGLPPPGAPGEVLTSDGAVWQSRPTGIAGQLGYTGFPAVPSLPGDASTNPLRALSYTSRTGNIHVIGQALGDLGGVAPAPGIGAVAIELACSAGAPVSVGSAGQIRYTVAAPTSDFGQPVCIQQFSGLPIGVPVTITLLGRHTAPGGAPPGLLWLCYGAGIMVCDVAELTGGP